MKNSPSRHQFWNDPKSTKTTHLEVGSWDPSAARQSLAQGFTCPNFKILFVLVRFGRRFSKFCWPKTRTVRSWTNRFWSVDPRTAWSPCKVKRILIYDFRMSVNQWKYARCWKVKKNVYLIYSMINSFGQRNENKITENYINIDK